MFRLQEILKISLGRTPIFIVSNELNMWFWLQSCIAIVASFAGLSKSRKTTLVDQVQEARV